MKIKVCDFDFSKIPFCKTYKLLIKHELNITQYYRIAENLKLKLEDYMNFNIIYTDEDKKNSIYTMSIEGKLPSLIQVKRGRNPKGKIVESKRHYTRITKIIRE